MIEPEWQVVNRHSTQTRVVDLAGGRRFEIEQPPGTPSHTIDY
jgi:hypothetical protein